MALQGIAKALGRARHRAEPALAKARATAFARRLQEAYEAGKRGDEDGGDEHSGDTTEAISDQASEASDSDAEQVATAMSGVDWAKVRAATAERTAEATAAMRSMAKQVDWAKVQPVAAKVSTALMAAVASGQLGVGGRLGGTVARAIINDGGLASKVSEALDRKQGAPPPDFRAVIDVTATDS